RLNHDELDQYLKDRSAKGFTVIQAYVLRGLGKKHPDGNSSLLDRDPTRLNEEFFKNVDNVVNRANELGLAAGAYEAQWINTRTGQSEKTETFNHIGGNRTVVSPKYSGDIALGMRRQPPTEAHLRTAPTELVEFFAPPEQYQSD